MSDLSDTNTVSDVGSESEQSSGHDNDDQIDDSDAPPVEIKDGRLTFFINDSSGILKCVLKILYM